MVQADRRNKISSRYQEQYLIDNQRVIHIAIQVPE